MLRVMSDALTAADQRRVMLIGLLDLSSVFDCVDHSLMLQQLDGTRTFVFSGMILRWLTSYITGRSQQVAFCGQLSPTQSVQFGVSQGSVLGPLLFVLYTADLSRVVAIHGLILHRYADDCQIYTSTPGDDAAAAIDQFSRCLDDVEAWLSSSRLAATRPLNQAKCQDASLVPGLQVPTAQGQHSRRSSPVNIRQDCRLIT